MSIGENNLGAPVAGHGLDQLRPDFDSVDSVLFAVLGAISLAHQTQSTLEQLVETSPVAPPSKQSCAIQTSNTDTNDADSPAAPDDLVSVLLGAVSLSNTVLQHADSVFGLQSLPTRTATTPTRPSSDSPDRQSEGLLR